MFLVGADAADDLGGQLRLAKEASWRKDVAGIVDWRRAELERLGVEVRMVDAGAGNLKVTQAGDLAIAEALLAARSRDA